MLRETIQGGNDKCVISKPLNNDIKYVTFCIKMK